MNWNSIQDPWNNITLLTLPITTSPDSSIQIYGDNDDKSKPWMIHLMILDERRPIIEFTGRDDQVKEHAITLFYQLLEQMREEQMIVKQDLEEQLQKCENIQEALQYLHKNFNKTLTSKG